MPRRSTLSDLHDYLCEIAETPLLTAAEEQTLARQIAGGNRVAWRQMIEANLRLVVNLARRFQRQGLDLADLIAEGNLGLICAVERFDPDRGCRFATFAVWWVLHYIRRALADLSRTVRLPTYLLTRLTKWRRASFRLQDQTGREPTSEEIGRELKLQPKQTQALKQVFPLLESNVYSDPPDGPTLEDRVCDTHQGPAEQAEHRDELDRLRQHMQKLRPGQAQVLRWRFGLDGEQKSLRAIGRIIGRSQERVRQIEALALAELRKRMSS